LSNPRWLSPTADLITMALANLWNTFTAVPHRIMFFGGALQIIAVMLWWLIELATRYGIAGHPMAWTTPAAAHAFLVIYGMLPIFIFGFLMTTFPRWMNGKEIRKRRYLNVRGGPKIT